MLKTILILLTITNTFFCQEYKTNLFIADYEGSKKISIPDLVQRHESILRNTTRLTVETHVYDTQYGSVRFFTMKPDILTFFPLQGKGELFRVVSAEDYSVVVGVPGVKTYRLSIHDVIMIDEPRFIVHCDPTLYKFCHFWRTISHKDTHNGTSQNEDEMIKNIVELSVLQNGKKEKKKKNLGLPKLINFGKENPVVDLDGIAMRLIEQNQRILNAPLGHNAGVSAVMFVLNGQSGCHIHARSDYIAWNYYGGSMQHVRFPEKFDSKLYEPAIMPINYVHELISHNGKSGNGTGIPENLNVLILYAFPGQPRGDSAPARGCLEP